MIHNNELKQIEKIDVLYKRVFLFLEEQNWEAAKTYCEKILDIEPENENAYLGKLLAEFQVMHLEELIERNIPIDGSLQYQKIMQYGSNELKKRLESCNRQILDRIKENKRQGIYEIAVQDLKWANTVGEYKAVLELFKPIAGYKDVDVLVEECKKDLEKLEQKKNKCVKYISIMGFIIVIMSVIIFSIIVPSIKYKMALNYVDKRNYIEAYKLFVELGDYKECGEQIKEIVEQDAFVAIKASQKGDIIKFGKYEQEEIEWIVLNKEDSEMLLLCNKCLVNKKYNEDIKTVGWKDSTLREWLNSDFYNIVFSTEEKKVIVKKEIDNELYDKVSLLTVDEVKKYFSGVEERKSGAIYHTANVGWWLRDNTRSLSAPVVTQTGEFERNGGGILYTINCGVRPIIYVKLE